MSMYLNGKTPLTTFIPDQSYKVEHKSLSKGEGSNSLNSLEFSSEILKALQKSQS